MIRCHLAVIWDALKAASKADIETAKLITESAGIIVGPPNLTICYDERGVISACIARLYRISVILPGLLACAATTSCSLCLGPFMLLFRTLSCSFQVHYNCELPSR
jgi:Ubiquitin-binding domain